MKKNNSPLVIIIIVSLLIILCCCITLCAGLGVLAVINDNSEIGSSTVSTTSTPVVIRPSATSTAVDTPTSQKTATNTAIPEKTDTLTTLENTIVPINDPVDIARRFLHKTSVKVTLEPPAEPFQVGDQQDFWVMNTDTNENFQVSATLQYITDHVYFWIEDDVNFDSKDLEKITETFENKIYPTDREFFGSEWTPGVDSDPHLYILYAKNLGGTVAGYFSSNDEYTPDAFEYSNSHEMFLLSADHTKLYEEYTYGVLAHEFQHMIHWYRDRNETTWMNEGFSELAMLLNNYTVGSAPDYFADDPDLQLTDWPTDPSKTYPHYGAAFLFMSYFLDRFGETATKAVVAHPANGMTSIDKVLDELDIKDPESNQTLTADQVFSDWTITNYLQDDSIDDGRYAYYTYANPPEPSITKTINKCPQENITMDVKQYGTDYIRIRCEGDYTLHFEGSITSKVIPADPHSGTYYFYSNKGDESHMRLTKTFDFTNQAAPLTLTYWTWYDIEEDYDYVYLTASTDGKNWEILAPPSSTSENPSGANYGWGYNGLSGDGPEWIKESVDISKFAGKTVQISFEYITDAATFGEGFLIDDIAVPEIGYFTDFENDDGGWQADGFVRIENEIPQTYTVSVLFIGEHPKIEKITLSEDNSSTIPLQLGDEYKEAILVVSGTSRFTRQKAAYRFSITP